MTESKSKHVVLGMHASDTLNVFVQVDGELHQAARIQTVNGVQPATMTAIMADLSDALGWAKIATVAKADVPHAVPLRAGGVVAALPAAGDTSKPEPEPTKVDFRRAPRRGKAQMKAQHEAVKKLLDGVPAEGALTTDEVATKMGKLLRIKQSQAKSSVLRSLHLLADEGVIVGTLTKSSVGTDSYRWHGA